ATSPSDGSPLCPRIANRSWCCVAVRPAALACSSLHRRNRRSPSRKVSSRSKSASSSPATFSDHIVSRYILASMLRPPSPRRLTFLTLLAAGLGAAGGGAAWVLLHLIDVVTSVTLFHRLA